MRRDARLAIAVVTARRAVRSGLVWGLVFAVYVASSAATYTSSYPTAAARAKFARSLEGNSGLAALLGPAHHLDTVAGFTAWRTMGVLTIVGAVWALLTATRLTRGEEEAGRWELLLSGRTTRGRAAGQATAGVAAGVAALWAVAAFVTIAIGRQSKVMFAAGQSLFLATALVSGAALFAAVGVLAAQVAGTRRQANSISTGVLAASYLIRMTADSGSGREWLRWASPLGWAENLRPMFGSRFLAFGPIVAFVVILVGGAVAIAARRDLGASVLRSRDTSPPHTLLLHRPSGLAIRLSRGTAAGWIGGLAVLGYVLGLVAQSASSAISGSRTLEKAIARLGGYRGGAATYLGVAFLTAAVLVAFAAAGQIASTHHEEANGYLDNLLVRRVARRQWLLGRLAVGAVIIVVGSVISGLAGWIGAASQHSGVSFPDLIQAGVNLAPPALFVLGTGALVYGLWPRLGPAFTSALVTWSFRVEFVASVVKSNHFLLDTSVIAHIRPVPAANPDWTAAAWLTGLGLAAAAAALVAFTRRDLAAA